MACRKHSPGDPCCQSPACCLADSDYVEWQDFPGYQPGSCCRLCEFSIVGDPWTLACSDPIRTDERSATADYKYYTTPFPVFYETYTTAPCPSTPKTLCATISESHTIVVIERLMMRYRKISQSSSIAKIQIICGEDPSACRWVVSSQICLDVEYGQFEFRSEDHDVTITDDGCCEIINSAWLKNIHTAMPTCAEKAAAVGFPTTTTVCIKRLKVFDTAPSGVITFADGDWVDCEDIGVCIRGGVESFSIASTDGGNAAWNAPSCVSVNNSALCQILLYTTVVCCVEPGFDGTVDLQQEITSCFIGAEECFCTYEWVDGALWQLLSTTCSGTYTCSVHAIGSSVTVAYARINPNNQLLTVPGQDTLAGIGVSYNCRLDCSGTNVQDKFISEVVCTLLTTPYHPTPVYTARTLGITLPSWTVDLGACP